MKHTISTGLVIALAVLMILAAMQAPAMASGGPPSPGAVYGYVSVNGIAANGISVSISGPGISDTYTTGSDAAGNSGYYQFGVLKGSSYTVSASYGGKTASSTITASGPEARADLDISYSGPPMPAAVYGYVTVDGDAANGIIVTLEGNGSTEAYMTRNDASGRAGYYQFGILSITPYTVTAGYNGQVVSLDFSTGAAKEKVDLPIPRSTGAVITATPEPEDSTVTPAPTPSPTPSPTVTPSAAPNPSDTPGDSTPTPTVNPTSLPSPSPVPFPGIEGLIAIALGGVILAMINKKG